MEDETRGAPSARDRDASGTLLYEQAQQLQGGGINPVQVFHNEQDRLPLRFPMQPGHERLQRLLALPLRRQSDGCIGGRQRE